MKVAGEKIGLSTRTFVAILLEAVLGVAIGESMTRVRLIRAIWLNCIEMTVVSMVLVTIAMSVIPQKGMKTLGRISFRVMAYYVITTLATCAIGVLVTPIVKPSTTANFTGLASKEVMDSADITVADFFTGMSSSNTIQTPVDGNILQTIVIMILLGVATLGMKNPKYKKKIIRGVNVFNDMVFSLINMIMLVSSISIFLLMGDSFGKYGASISTSVTTLVGTYYLAYLVHVALIYRIVIWVTAGTSPPKFLGDGIELWVYTISAYFSAAAILINIKVARKKFNVLEIISGFTVSLSLQMSHDGSAILYDCVVLFISQTTGAPVTLGTMVRVILMSVILSTSSGGILGSGIVGLLVMVAVFGLPTEIIGIITAFYRLFNMETITNNCPGDLTGMVLISKLEDKVAARAKSA